jgi:hypothetical protein
VSAYGPPVCLVRLTGPDQFVSLPTRELAARKGHTGAVHGAPVIEIEGASFRKSGRRTLGGWLIYIEQARQS